MVFSYLLQNRIQNSEQNLRRDRVSSYYLKSLATCDVYRRTLNVGTSPLYLGMAFLRSDGRDCVYDLGLSIDRDGAGRGVLFREEASEDEEFTKPDDQDDERLD